MARHDVLAEALALPESERARIARELLRSLDDVEEDDPEAIERAWTEEISRRIDELDAGTGEVEDWPAALAELRATLDKRRAGQ